MAWEIPEELKQEFRASAKERVDLALAALMPDGVANEVVVQMHTLAGEASMLGMMELGEAARNAEAAGKAWVAAPSAQTQLTCAKLVRSVGRLLAAESAP